MSIKVVLHPQEVAERLVAELRSEGLIDYPFLASDLDEEIARWCDVRGVEPVPCALVRGVMATLPGVERMRPWLNQFSAEHQHIRRYIRRRQRAHGEESDRPTVYMIGDEP
jgi:hypothetical protein